MAPNRGWNPTKEQGMVKGTKNPTDGYMVPETVCFTERPEEIKETWHPRDKSMTTERVRHPVENESPSGWWAYHPKEGSMVPKSIWCPALGQGILEGKWHPSDE